MNTIVLFKNNLRYQDNPVLHDIPDGSKVIPVYIHDENYTKKVLGAASKYWLHHALESLNSSLDNKLMFFKGDTQSILDNLINSGDVKNVISEEAFLKDDIHLQNKIKSFLKSKDVSFKTYNCTLLWEPYSVFKDDGTPYKVFTPFYRKGCVSRITPPQPLGKPIKISYAEFENKTKIENLNLISKYDWYSKFSNLWDISENRALSIFYDFTKKPIYNYKKGRDFPSQNFNSRLSPYIRFGMISVNRIWHEVSNLISDKNTDHFKSEIGWREFSYYLLYHFPEMQSKNLQSKFDNFEWENSPEKFEAWKKGETGFPIIDAGMKELWQTGYMHNRIRMVVSSFLVKNLSIDWKLGEQWFWDCLLDADYASNIAGWQWVAGTGSDAAPYFRIFNPILQGEKFDETGEYTLKYLPELKTIPLKYLQKPWEINSDFNYIKPIIDYKESRETALTKYSMIK